MPNGFNSVMPKTKHTQPQWNRVNELFHEALDAEAASRTALVIAATGNDEIIRREVLRLLEEFESMGSFLERDAVDLPTSPSNGDDRRRECDSTDAPEYCAGSHVGRFQLVRLIACGGMGEVWLAERSDAEFRQQVAIKIMRKAWSHQEGLRLFTRERQMLARLEHPAITRLIDGGATADGRPYLVMEFVEGRPITQYCDALRLTVRERLELFAQTCHAVHYAHQKLVVHRDLKPSNILVGQDRRPRLLDFGIAALLETESAGGGEGEINTRTMSPDYASPEQLRGQPCSTAGDVYSLGLILHKLVCGLLPEKLGGVITRLAGGSSPQHRAERAPTDARLLLDVQERDLDHIASLARARRTSVHGFRRLLRGDLRAIVHRALADDPNRRYGSVIELLEDIRRYLNRLPVRAQAPSLTYRARRFAQRNRFTLISTVLVVGAVLAGLVVSWAGWSQAHRERATATATTEFLESVFGAMSPYAAGSDPSVLDLLEAASRRATFDLQTSPAVEHRVRLVLARTYASLWKWDLAYPEAERAVFLARQLTGDSSLMTTDCLTLLGRAQSWRHDKAAVDTQREALAIRTALLGENDRAVAEAKICLAFALLKSGSQQDQTEAARSYADGIETYRAVGDVHSHDYARALFSFASFRIGRGERGHEILSMLEETVEVYERKPGSPDRYVASAIFAYGDHLTYAGRNKEGESYLRKYLDMAPPELDRDWTVIVAYYRLGEIALLDSDIEGAGMMFKKALLGQAARRWDESEQSRLTCCSPQAIAETSDPRALIEHFDCLLSSMRQTPWRGDWRLLEFIASVAATMSTPEVAEPVDRLFDQMFTVLEDRFGGERALVAIVRLCQADLEAQRGHDLEAAALVKRISAVFIDDPSQTDLHCQRARRLERMLHAAD